MDLQQSRYVVIDAYIEKVSDGAPVTGLTTSTLNLKYKKPTQVSLSTKTFFSITGDLDGALSIGDTEVPFIDPDDLEGFPMSGRFWIDKGGANEELCEFTRISTLEYATVTTGVTLNHLNAEVITLHDFWEVGTGIYSFLLSPSEVDTLGSLLTIADPTSADNRNYVKFYDVVPATTSSVAPVTPSLSTCLVYGYILNSLGQPEQNISVAAKVVTEPDISTLVNSRSALLTRVVQTRSDASGYFSLAVVQTTTIEVTIPEVSFRKVFEVPSSDTYELFV